MNSINTTNILRSLSVILLILVISACSSAPKPTTRFVTTPEKAQAKFPREMLEEGRRLTGQNWGKKILEPYTPQNQK